MWLPSRCQSRSLGVSADSFYHACLFVFERSRSTVRGSQIVAFVKIQSPARGGAKIRLHWFHALWINARAAMAVPSGAQVPRASIDGTGCAFDGLPIKGFSSRCVERCIVALVRFCLIFYNLDLI